LKEGDLVIIGQITAANAAAQGQSNPFGGGGRRF
jgi:hypothetical protein